MKSTVYFLVATVLLGSFGQVCMKIGTRAQTGFLKTLLSPWVIVGVGLYGISTLIWLKVLERLALSVAYPIMSLSYIITTGLAWWLLKESVSATQVAGVLVIGLGVCLVAVGRIS